METAWRPLGDRLETAWRPLGDRLETAWRPLGDRFETASRPLKSLSLIIPFTGHNFVGYPGRLGGTRRAALRGLGLALCCHTAYRACAQQGLFAHPPRSQTASAQINQMPHAKELLRLRAAGLLKDTLPSIPSLQQAYHIQASLAERMLARERGRGRVVGWKVANTNKTSQEFLNLHQPFWGALLSPLVLSSGEHVSLSERKLNVRLVEPEFAFRMGEPLPPKPDGQPYSVDEVRRTIATVHPALEIIHSSFVDWKAENVGVRALIADLACNGVWCYGEGVRFRRDMDLASHGLDLRVNGAHTHSGDGSRVGDPVEVLTWLANILAYGTEAEPMCGVRHGANDDADDACAVRGLREGEFVTTGVVVDPPYHYANAGDKVEADFGTLGTVALSFGE